MAHRQVADWDSVLDGIAAALGAEGPDGWLTVDFTGSEAWA
jgi:predicted Co/Zn/Cd cation transporter (cation efflux family)